MEYQEQFQLIFIKKYSDFSKRHISLCKIESALDRSIVLAELLNTASLGELEDVLTDIERTKDGIILGDELAFDGMENELFFDQNIARLGGTEFALIEFEGILSEWIKFCSE